MKEDYRRKEAVPEGLPSPPRRKLNREDLRRELRRRRKQRKKARRRSLPAWRRYLPVGVLFFFLFLCLASTVFTLAEAGGSDSCVRREIAASNAESLADSAAGERTVLEPDIPAAAAFLLDPETGDVLYEKNPDTPLPMASTTKIITAVLVLENADLEERVTVSRQASSVGESSAWLEEGEVLTVKDLLYALLLQSANDAAVALAEHVGGSVERFVEMMNERARELGAENTHFANPHGLDQEGHYTTARDLAAIASHAMHLPFFRRIVATSSYQIPWPGHQWPRVFENHNRFLSMYPYATGIKTGYTRGAGKCLVASAEKEGRELISVILNDENYWEDTVTLMNYGFDDHVRVEFLYGDQPLGVVKVGDFPRREVEAVPTRDLVFTVRVDRLDDFMTAELNYREWLPYPVQKGQEVGYIQVGEGEEGGRVEPLVSAEERACPGALVRFLSFIGSVIIFILKLFQWLIPGI